MNVILFCRDGTLRARKSVRDRRDGSRYGVLVPLREMESVHPGYFLSSLGSAVEFEEGIEVGETLRNLAPWSAEVGAIAHCDFDAFLREIDRPAESDLADDIGYIGFVHSYAASAAPDFERDVFGDDTFERVPGSPFYRWNSPSPKVTDRLRLESDWDCGGFRTDTADFLRPGPDNRYSMSFSPLRDWHHLKIHVETRCLVDDRTVSSDYLTHQGGLLAAGHPLVAELRQEREGEEATVYARTVEVEAPGPTLYDLVLRCLVWEIGFHGSPEETAEASETLKGRADEADEGRALADSVKNEDGSVDEAGFEALEARFAAEEAQREAEREVDIAENPFDEDDQAILGMALRMAESDPDGVRFPDGLPEHLTGTSGEADDGSGRRS